MAQELTLLRDTTLLQLTEALLSKSDLQVFVPGPPGFQHTGQRVRRPLHTAHHS